MPLLPSRVLNTLDPVLAKSLKYRLFAYAEGLTDGAPRVVSQGGPNCVTLPVSHQHFEGCDLGQSLDGVLGDCFPEFAVKGVDGVHGVNIP